MRNGREKEREGRKRNIEIIKATPMLFVVGTLKKRSQCRHGSKNIKIVRFEYTGSQ